MRLWSKSLVFKEHAAQSIRKAGLGALGLARAGWFGDAGFGVAPCVYYMGRVKDYWSGESIVRPQSA